MLRKITVDNSVRYIPKFEQTKETENKPKSTKAGSLSRRQNKSTSRNSKKFVKDFAASRFGILEGIMNFTFN